MVAPHFVCTLQLKDFVWSTENRLLLFLVQENRVTDHRLKMNFELMSFLGGNIESAVQVNYTYNLIYLIKFLYLPFFQMFSFFFPRRIFPTLMNYSVTTFFTVLHCYGAEGITRRISRVGWCT